MFSASTSAAVLHESISCAVDKYCFTGTEESKFASWLAWKTSSLDRRREDSDLRRVDDDEGERESCEKEGGVACNTHEA